MKREFLEGLNLSKEIVDKIMKEHGISVQAAKPDDYEILKQESNNYKGIIADLENKLEEKDSEYSNFKEQEQAMLTKINSFEKKELKYKVAREYDIPFDLADRLSGTTEEDMVEDAKVLSSFVKTKEFLPLKDFEKEKNDPYEDMVTNLTTK